jgi:CDP-diacylglycerol--glycerol-3-phosphate 3-phosphatidyltransferase
MTLRRAPSLNLPNQLTVLRLGMCGLLLISLSISWPYAAFTALLIFSAASITDWLDGAIARRYQLVTDLGKLLDPLADKVLIIGTLVALVQRGIAPMWMVVLIITREFLITGLRTIAAHKQVILAAERIGKHKTISQIVAILVSLAWLSLGEFGLADNGFGRLLEGAQIWLYWIALIITVLSGAFYFWKNAAMLNETMAENAEPIPPATPDQAPPEKETGFPAFKEWEGIVEALGHGAQIIILRKGGGPGRIRAAASQVLALPHPFSPAMGKDQAGPARPGCAHAGNDAGNHRAVSGRGDRCGLSRFLGPGRAAR